MDVKEVRQKVKKHISLNLQGIYSKMQADKKLPFGKGERVFIVGAARKRYRPVINFSVAATAKTAFEGALEKMKRNFTLLVPQWYFAAIVTEEKLISKEEFVSMLSEGEGFSQWDGVTFDKYYSYAILKNDLDNNNLIVNTDGKFAVNDSFLTENFKRKGIITFDAAFTTENLKYVTLFKIDGYSSYNGELFGFKTGALAYDSRRPSLIADFSAASEEIKSAFDNKLTALKKAFKADRTAAKKVNSLSEKGAFISVTDGCFRAMVFSGCADDISKAIDIAAEKAKKYLLTYSIFPKWVKLDAVTKLTQVSKEDLTRDLKGGILINPSNPNYRKHGDSGAYYYPQGISLDNNFEKAFISQEVNTRYIWDFQLQKFDINAVNTVLQDKGVSKIEELPDMLYVFSCAGYFSNADNSTLQLRTDKDYFGRRNVKIDKPALEEMVKQSVEFLLDTQKSDGSYVYGYHPASGKMLSSYNILRHIATSPALLQYAHLTGSNDTSAADKSNNYAIKYIKYLDKDTAFLYEELTKEFKLGASGVTAVALASYSDFFPTAKYNELIRVIANGILTMQEEDGSWFHVLDENFKRKERTRIVYYEGEAVYGLIKAYEVLKDKKYLDAAEKSVKYFIANNCEKHRDHWIAYAVNHITVHIPKQEYFDFGLWNATSNLKKIYNRRISFHTYLELLTQTFTLCVRLEKLIEEGADLRFPEFFNKADLVRTMLYRVEYMANSYLYPEFAMYMDQPHKVVGTFSVRHWDWRIRIDDLNHYIGGFYEFIERYDELEKFLQTNPVKLTSKF